MRIVIQLQEPQPHAESTSLSPCSRIRTMHRGSSTRGKLAKRPSYMPGVTDRLP